MNKKILIVGLAFEEAFGTGVTLRNLFSQIQPNQLGVVDFCVSYKDYKYSKSLFNIRLDAEILEDFSRGMKSQDIDNIKTNVIKLSILSLRRHLAYYYNNYVQCKITPKLKEFVTSFSPDFIYVVPYNRKVINLALKISNLNNIPIVTHFMDDFRNRSPKDILYFLNEYFVKQKIKFLINKSYQCLAICDYMSEEYNRIFKTKFHSFHNPIQTSSFQNFKVISTENIIKELKIVYTGTIAENNYDTLIKFCSICENYSAGETKIYFDIFSPYSVSNIFYQRLVKSIKNFKYTTLKGGIIHSEVIPTLFKYNMLLLPLSFKKKSYSVIEFSFPTKVAEYMASGIPTLYILPKGIALHHYLVRNKIEYLIDDLNNRQIESFLQSFIRNPTLRVENIWAKEISYANFFIENVALKFKNLFN